MDIKSSEKQMPGKKIRYFNRDLTTWITSNNQKLYGTPLGDGGYNKP